MDKYAVSLLKTGTEEGKHALKTSLVDFTTGKKKNYQ